MARNEVTLEGFIRKLELRFAAQSGKAFLSLTVPIDRRRFNKQSQEWETENTTWWNLTTVGSDAEFQSENLKEGDLIQFTGLPELEVREGKDGRTFHNAVMKFPVISKVIRAPKDYQGGGQQAVPQSRGAQSGGFGRSGFQGDSGGFSQQPGGWETQQQGAGFDATDDGSQPPF